MGYTGDTGDRGDKSDKGDRGDGEGGDKDEGRNLVQEEEKAREGKEGNIGEKENIVI